MITKPAGGSHGDLIRDTNESMAECDS